MLSVGRCFDDGIGRRDEKEGRTTPDAAMTAELMCLTKEQGVSLTESGRTPETVHQNRPQNRVERGDHQAHHIGHDKNPRQIGTRRTSFGGRDCPHFG